MPSINYSQANEEDWPKIKDYLIKDIDSYDNLSDDKPVPPIVINSQYVPHDIDNYNITIDNLPNIYTGRMDNLDDKSIQLKEYIKTWQ